MKMRKYSDKDGGRGSEEEKMERVKDDEVEEFKMMDKAADDRGLTVMDNI